MKKTKTKTEYFCDFCDKQCQAKDSEHRLCIGYTGLEPICIKITVEIPYRSGPVHICTDCLQDKLRK